MSDLFHLAKSLQGLSMLLQMSDFLFFFSWLNNIPLCVWVTASLSIHLFMETWVVSTSGCVSDAEMDMWMHILLGEPISLPLDIHTVMRFKNQKIVLFLIFSEPSILFSIVALVTFSPYSHQHLLASILCFIITFWNYPFQRYVVTSHYTFDLHCLDD